ncbi:hypothetical protein BCC0191_005932 [Burkholderia ambifaria]|jgi:hypothetical protein
MFYPRITFTIAPANRTAAARVYQEYKAPFLNTITGARSKELLVRDEDVQVLHGFDSEANALGYLSPSRITRIRAARRSWSARRSFGRRPALPASWLTRQISVDHRSFGAVATDDLA